MFYIYLASLIFGGSLLAFSILFGGDHSDSHIDHHLNIGDLGTDTALDAHNFTSDIHSDISDIHSDVSDIHSDITTSHSDIQQHIVHDAGSAVSFVSFRNFVFFSAFFGLTGVVLDLLAIPFFWGLIGSLALGSFAWVSGYKFMKYFKASETGKSIDIYSLKGKSAVVTIKVSKAKNGKVFVNAGSEKFEMQARLSSISKRDEINAREEVLIIDIRNNILYIDEYIL